MKGSLRYRLLFLALVLLLGLCLLNPSLLNTYLIDPLTRIAWLVIRTFLLIDQDVYWFLLIFAVFTFVLRILPTRPQGSLPPAYADTTRQEDRVAYWEALLCSAEDRADSRFELQQALSHLNQSIQALSDGGDSPAIDLPPGPSAVRHRPQKGMKALLRFRSLFNSDEKRNTDLEKHVSPILKSLETLLEKNND